MRTDPVAVAVGVIAVRNGRGRIALWLYGPLTVVVRRQGREPEPADKEGSLSVEPIVADLVRAV
jgi:hypothetical protein